jgi:spore coat polysaccharide biosynthesis protein SpsF (cytidylyltransferase family)
MIGIIIQARTGSNRFPRKIYEDINGKYTLQRVLEGCTSAKLPHKIILAMPEYDKIELAKRTYELMPYIDERFESYFGSADNLVERYFFAARKYGLDLIVRITADCPLTQGQMIDEMLCEYLKNNYNGYFSNTPRSSHLPHPDGVDVEIFPYWMLAETYQLAKDPLHLEHCTPYMYRRGTQYKTYPFLNMMPNTMISNLFPNFSFDTTEDLILIKGICEYYDVHRNLDKSIQQCGLKDQKH